MTESCIGEMGFREFLMEKEIGPLERWFEEKIGSVLN
jgi:hypothetical protein